MGLFDFFRGKSPSSAPPRPSDKTIARHAEQISRKAQNYDRQEALDALIKMGTKEAATALLKRFTFTVDPSITDEEEKDSAFHGIVSAGNEALPAIREFCVRAESLTWPLRMMREILRDDDDAYVGEIVAMLDRLDTEYDRNPDPKIQLLTALEQLRHPKTLPAVQRFLEDVHEPARFHAATTLLAQENPEAAGPMAMALIREEAMRTKVRIADGLATRGWVVPESMRAEFSPKLPRAYSLDETGRVIKR